MTFVKLVILPLRVQVHFITFSFILNILTKILVLNNGATFVIESTATATFGKVDWTTDDTGSVVVNGIMKIFIYYSFLLIIITIIFIVVVSHVK